MSLCPHGYTAFWDCPTCEEPMGTAPRVGASLVRYRAFVITYDPPPIPDRQHDYRWSHEDYDGPEDRRCGTSPSLAVAKAAIDEWYAEREEAHEFGCTAYVGRPCICDSLRKPRASGSRPAATPHEEPPTGVS